MKTIHKAILKELAFTFFLSLISLNFILMMEKILRLSRLLSGVSASISDMMKMIAYLQPQLMILTLPMSLLLSTLLTYGRLSVDNELVILKSSGMSFKGISSPVFIVGLSCFFAGTLVSLYFGPLSAAKLKEAISGIITSRAPLAVEEGVFNTSFKDVVILVREKPTIDKMREIFIYDGRNKKEPRVLTAREGRIYANGGYNLSLYLKDGHIHLAKEKTSTELFFEGYNLSLSLAVEPLSRKNSELTPIELLQEAKKKGDDGDDKERMAIFLELHRRLSLPSVCLLLMLLGPPLSLLSGKSGRLGGLTIGLSVFTVFYILLIYGENMARSGKIPHYLGAWSPTIILGLFALWVFHKESNE